MVFGALDKERIGLNEDTLWAGGPCPLMKGSTEFFLDTLVADPNTKYLVTCPSISPENPHGRGGATIGAGPACDQQLLRDLLDHTVAAAQTLNLDSNFRDEVRTARNRLAPDRIGEAGQLQERQDDWDMIYTGACALRRC